MLVASGRPGLGCPKVDLQVVGDSAQVVAFSREFGYPVEDRVSLGWVVKAQPEADSRV